MPGTTTEVASASQPMGIEGGFGAATSSGSRNTVPTASAWCRLA